MDSIALSIMAVIDLSKQNGAVSKPGTDTVTTVLIVGAGESTFWLIPGTAIPSDHSVLESQALRGLRWLRA